MSSETRFRLAVIAVLVLSITTAGYYRLQAAKSGERVSRHNEGRILFLSIRLAGLLLLIATLAYLIAPDSLRWARVPLPEPVRWLGAALGLLAILLLYWTLSTLGRNLTDTVATRASHTLVTNGPYRWVRHPYYVSLLLLVCATALLSASWFILLAGALVFLLLAIRAPIEEQKLIERFGEDYQSYMARTGRFVPRL